MVQYRDLNAPPSRMLADVVADMKAQGRQSKTGDAGVKDLGETGDVVWPRPDGTPVSVRDVDLELADARQRIEDAEGTLTGAQARIDTALDAEGHIREDEILRNATLLGETVVEQINVTDKLIGKDGVFTGTVDFENINVTDQVLASRISGEHIYGTVVEGGEIRTTDGLPGQVILSDEGYVDSSSGARYPGIRIVPFDSSELVSPPGIGPNSNGFIITGGRNTAGGRGFSIYGPNTATMSFQKGNARSNVAVSDRTAWINTRDGYGNLGEVVAEPSSAAIRAKMADGAGGSIEVNGSLAQAATRDPTGNYMARLSATGREASLLSRASDGVVRQLKVDTNGVWASTNESGSWQHVSLIPQVRPFQYSAQWNADQSPAHIMVQHLPGGKLCQAQIRIQNLTGSSLSLPNATWVTLNYNPIPADLRGGYTDYIDITLPQNEARGRVEMNYSTGSIRIRNISGTDIAWTNNSSIWFPMRWFSPN